MFGLLKQSPTKTIPLAATGNDSVYATPKDYMSLILKSENVKAKVAMHFLMDRETIVLYVVSSSMLGAERTIELEKLLNDKIPVETCRRPKYVFWTFKSDPKLDEVF